MDPLQMDDTLPSILKHLDAPSLKSCRFVSKFWNKMAAKQLFRSNFLKIPSDFRKQVRQTDNPTTLNMELVKAQEFIENLGSLPNIQISDENLESDLEILKLLQIRWTKIGHLKLCWRLHQKIEVYETFLEEIKILCGPQSLNFLEIPAQVNSDTEHSPFSHKLGTALLDFCTFMDSRTQKNVPLILSHFSAIVSSQKDAENLEKLLHPKCCVHILNLQIKPLSSFKYDSEKSGKNLVPGLVHTLEKIMEVNKNRVQSLQINDYNAKVLPGNLQIPKMPHLTLLQLKCDRQSLLSFQRGFQFSSHFPALHEVEILVGNVFFRQNPFWESFFNQRIEPAKSVKKLRIVSLDSIDRRIFETFPNVEELQLCDLIVLRMEHRILQMVSTYCTKLRRLGLDLPSNKFEAHRAHLRFSATLVGFSMERVKRMMAMDGWGQVCGTKEKTENMVSRKKSLLDFPDLAELDLICGDDKDYSDFSSNYMAFLQHRVFSRMPNLLQVKRVSKSEGQGS